MSIFQNFIQNSIKSCNFFTSPVNLRYKLDPDYNTFAGGVVSIVLVVLLVSVFFGNWVSVLSKDDIISNTQIIREFDPSSLKFNTNNFMFAIGIDGINLTDFSMKKYFDLKIEKIERIKGATQNLNSTILDLEPCTIAHWESFGQEFVETFHRQQLNSFLCIPKNTEVEIIGKWTSERFSYIQISFKKCSGQLDCRDQSEIDQWIAQKTAFYFDFFYTNQLLNPDEKQPITKIFEDKDYIMFTPTLGAVTNLYLGEYTMETDESIFPWIDQKIDQGLVVNRVQKQTLNYVPNPSDSYCQLVLRKSNAKLQISRKFRKLDDLLSYIGGLFGIICFAIGIVMKYYGQCAFELQMCQKIFDYNTKSQIKDKIKLEMEPSIECVNFGTQSGSSENSFKDENQVQELIEPKDFGFFDFLIYLLIYVPLRKFLPLDLKWKKMKIYEESLEQMRHKLDISQLFQKLTFYDRSINAMFDENQLKLLYLQEKINFREVREERNMLGMREGIVANLFELESRQFRSRDQNNTVVECKKSLKQIVEQRNSKMLQIWIGNPQSLQNFKKTAGVCVLEDEEREIFRIPPDIQNALKKLDSKIEKGDLISTRIYNGLQYELLEAFEKSKLNRNNHRVTSKKIKRIKGSDYIIEEISKRTLPTKKSVTTNIFNRTTPFDSPSLMQLTSIEAMRFDQTN